MKRTIYIVGFLFSFSTAIAAYVNSSFIESIGGKNSAGILYAISAALGIYILSHASKIIGRIGARTFFVTFALIQALALVVLIAPFPLEMRMVAFTVYLTAIFPLLFCLDVFFQHVVPHRSRGKMRGLFLLLINLAWLCGPITSAYLKDSFDFAGIYTGVCIVLLSALCLVAIGLAKYTDAEYKTNEDEKTFLRAFKEKKFRPVIFCNFLLQFFYACMVIYSPIYLHDYLAFSWDSIAIVFTIMLSAFVVLDYPLGKFADWLGSEKEFTVIGFVCMALSVFGIFFAHTPSVLTIAGLLLLSRIGAATVEAMTEIHFFKIAKDFDPGILSVFRDLYPASYIIAPLFGTIIIAFLPFRSIFGILGIVLLFGIIVAFFLEKKSEWWVRSH